ncbi:aspartate transaminase [Bradyrhizobium sp. AZCC 2230]|uniref:aspartate transaminase n=1 Tax=Bradyrhizobium sp. AZCC 2230 TaxID=3117021 RepID=UPI002FEFA3C0
MMALSERVKRIKVSPTTAAAQRVRDLKAQGRAILDLTIGEPDFDTPAHIRQAAVNAIARGETKYTPANGIAPLREAIATKMTQRTGVPYTADRITVGGGGKQVIFLALMATLNPGSEVIIPAPYWVSYPDMVLANDGTPVIVTCPQQQSFKLTPSQLEAAITPNTRWLVLNTPGNPTGIAYDAAELRALAEVLRRHPHVGVLTDEIYDEVWFKRETAPSLVQAVPDFADRVFIVNGVSKTYAMTGWRIGYGAGPKSIIDAINVLQSQSSSCPAAASQFAALAAITGPQDFIAASVAVYARRRDLALGMLNTIPGLNCLKPDGGFYLFPNCSAFVGRKTPEGTILEDDRAFVLHLLDAGSVAAVHGSAYGLPGYFRISISTDDGVIERGCASIAAVCRDLA